jgi:hypothetical protein
MVQHWRRSGLSIRDFCTAQGLSEPNFYAWRRTIAQRDAAAAQFVPVRVVPDPKAVAASDGPGTGLELVIGHRRLRIGPGFDAPTLQRLLALLEEGQS